MMRLSAVNDPFPQPPTTGENAVNAEPTDLVLTIEEAAKRLRIGRTLMYALIKNGEIRTVTIGRLRRVPVQCVAEYVNSLLEHPQAIAPAA
jgi:excisionase family DNA binding protein